MKLTPQEEEYFYLGLLALLGVFLIGFGLGRLTKVCGL